MGNLSYVHWEVPPGINGSQNHTIRVFGVPGRSATHRACLYAPANGFSLCL